MRRFALVNLPKHIFSNQQGDGRDGEGAEREESRTNVPLS